MSISQAIKVIVIKFINIHYLLKSSAQALDFFRNKDGMLNKWKYMPAPHRVWKTDLKRNFQRTDKGVWKRF